MFNCVLFCLGMNFICLIVFYFIRVILGGTYGTLSNIFQICCIPWFKHTTSDYEALFNHLVSNITKGLTLKVN